MSSSSSWSGWSKRLRKQRRKLVKRRGKRLIARVNGYLTRQSLVPDQPYYTAADFPWVEALEAQTPAIRAELERVLELRDDLPRLYELQRDQHRISGHDGWKSFVFQGWGHHSQVARELCPVTTGAIDAVPGVQTAFFSVLAPGGAIPEHRGFVKGLLRCQLALVVPEKRQDCVLTVSGIPHWWEEGRTVVFDDTFPHSVRNDTNQERVVLLLHFERPMTRRGRAAHHTVMFLLRRTAFVKEALANHTAWEQRFRRLVADQRR